MKISARLFGQIKLIAISFIVALFFSLGVMQLVQVNGPLYKNIIQGKDLIADILPPPEYILESFLVTYQLVQGQEGETAALIERMTVLEKDYDTRHEYWIQDLEESSMKDDLIKSSYTPAKTFYKIYHDEFLPLINEKKFEEAKVILNTKMLEAYNGHRKAIDSVVTAAVARTSSDEQTARTIILVSILTLILMFSLIIYFLYKKSKTLTNEIVIPLEEMSAVASNLSKGELSQTISYDGNDEIGELAKSFKEMITYLQKNSSIVELIGNNDLRTTPSPLSDKDVLSHSLLKTVNSLKNFVGQIQTHTKKLASGVTGLSSTSTSLSQSVTEQAASLEEINSSISEITQKTVQVSEKSRTTLTTISAAQLSANQGKAEMRNLIDSIADLKVSSEEIAKINKVIDEIAFQTNLLALNAAVEAARAGTYGKGFAVVAEEVRNLADRSAKASKETGTLIDKIVKKMDGAVSFVKLTEISFEKIVTDVKDATTQVQTVSEEADIQARAVTEISKALRQIDQVTTTNASFAEESASLAQELTSISKGVDNQLQKFKLN